MGFMINAWLDQAKPELSIINKERGTTVMQFSAEEINSMIETGELCPSDLLTINTHVLEEVILNLALYRCAMGAPSPL